MPATKRHILEPLMAWKILAKRGVACMLSPTLPKKFKRNVLPEMKTDLILSLLRYQYF